MLNKLLGNLHSVFDKSPEPWLALRLRHPSGLSWKIDNRALVLETEAGQPIGTLDLTALTLDQCADAAVALGCEIAYQHPNSGFSAECLLEGAGRQSDSNGDHLYAYDSHLWALLDAYAASLEEADGNIVDGLKQAYLHSAEAEWLDLWGGYFGVARDVGEADAAYVLRVVREVLRPRVNGIAIEMAVKELTGLDVTLREPWKEIFTLDLSALSDQHHFQDGSFYTWNVFQPIYHSPVTVAQRERILAIIERNRPVGSLVVADSSQPPTMHGVAAFDWLCGSTVTAVYNFGLTHYQPNVLSSSLALSDSWQDGSAIFLWRNYGIITLTMGADPLGLFGAPVRWDAGRTWEPYTWWSGSAPMVVTQHSV